MTARDRLYLLLANYGTTLAIVLVLVAGVAGATAWDTWSNPPTETISEETDRQEYEMAVRSEADVSPDNATLYEPGETLENMPAYFYEETPELRLVVETSLPEDERVEVDHRVSLAFEGERSDEPFYDRTELLAGEEDTVRDGEARLETTIDMVELAEEASELDERVSGVGSFSTTISVNVTFEDRNHAGELADETEIVFAEEAYWLDERMADGDEHTETRTQQVVQDPDMGAVLPLAGMGALAILLAGVSLVAARQGIDVEAIETRLAHAEFDEWISSGRIPTRGDREYVEVDSLEDLVDVAIDSNKRVIHQEEIETYAIVDGDVVYYYTAGDEDIGEWLEL